MLRRLEIDALRADLASVAALLDARTEHDDPVGWVQFSRRKEQLEAELAKFATMGGATSAGVAIFFGGRPVIGSRGILADFGTKAIGEIQNLIATQFASLDGPIGKRGPVPQRDRAQLMITDIARGSVGFILEEASENEELLETPLRQVVDDVCDLIYRISSPDEENFEEAAASVDDRVLVSLKTFFGLLDDSGATLRIAKEKEEFLLSRENIERARQRTDALELSEHPEDVRGTLYVLPEGRKFELHPADGSCAVRGTISDIALRAISSEGTEVKKEFIGNLVQATLRVKEARLQNNPPRRSYTLMGVQLV